MDINALMWQLKCGLINETSVPTSYLRIPEIAAVILQYRWYTGYSSTPGWTTLIRYVNYSS